MIGTVLILGLLGGADNLQATAAIGVLPLQGARKHLLAAAFITCEIAAPLAGLGSGHLFLRCAGSAAPKIGPLMMLACGIGILLCAFRQEDSSSLLNEPKFFVGLPLVLSFDNFLIGAGISSLHYPVAISALLIGLVSAAMSCLGLYLGSWFRQFIPGRTEFAVGAYLCILAVRALSIGGA